MTFDDAAFWEAMDEYKDVFGEQFPTMEMMDATADEVVSIIRKCLKDGKPYESPNPDDVIY